MKKKLIEALEEAKKKGMGISIDTLMKKFNKTRDQIHDSIRYLRRLGYRIITVTDGKRNGYMI